MKPSIYHVNLYEGDDFTLGVTLRDQNKQPLPLAGATFTARIRKADGTATIPLTVEVVDAAAGRVQIRGEAEELAQVTGGTYIWQSQARLANPQWGWSLQMDRNGTKSTLLTGTVSMSRGL